MKNGVLLLFGQKLRQVLRTRKPSDNSGPLEYIPSAVLPRLAFFYCFNSLLLGMIVTR